LPDAFGVSSAKRARGLGGAPSVTRRSNRSQSVEEPLPWSNSTPLSGEATEAVARLKEHLGKGLQLLGSAPLVQSLMRRGLIDEYLLSIHPLVLG
jgi:dihydrofolate reductase